MTDELSSLFQLPPNCCCNSKYFKIFVSFTLCLYDHDFSCVIQD